MTPYVIQYVPKGADFAYGLENLGATLRIHKIDLATRAELPIPMRWTDKRDVSGIMRCLIAMRALIECGNPLLRAELIDDVDIIDSALINRRTGDAVDLSLPFAKRLGSIAAINRVLEAFDTLMEVLHHAA